MTVPIQPNEFNYVGDGASTEFAFPSRFAKPDHLEVTVDALLKLLGVNYTVADDGTVTFLPGNVPAAAAAVKIRRNTPAQRETSFLGGGNNLRLNVLDEDLDNLAMALQDRDAKTAENTSEITGLKERVTAAEETLVQHGGRLDALEAQEADREMRLANMEVSIAALLGGLPAMAAHLQDATAGQVYVDVVAANDPAAKLVIVGKTDDSANAVTLRPAAGTAGGLAEWDIEEQGVVAMFVPHATTNNYLKIV